MFVWRLERGDVMLRSLQRVQGWKDSLVLKQREVVVYRDQPGRLGKTGVVSGWMKKDRRWGKNRREEERALLAKRLK